VSVDRRSFELRTSLVLLRRVALPMREVLNTVVRRDVRAVSPELIARRRLARRAG
jgi:magnesium transporter